MTRSILLATFLWSAAAHAASAEAPLAAARPTIRKTLAFLAADMRAWRAEQGCAACHHGPMYVWASHAARRQRYAVDDAYLNEMTEWLVTKDEARIFRKPSGDAPPRLSQSTIFLAHALDAVPQENLFRNRGLERIVEHLAASQKAAADDASAGFWTGPQGRPPIFHSPEIITRWAALALTSPAAPHEQEPFTARQRMLAERAQRWLAANSRDVSQQGLTLRLWQATLEKGASERVTRLSEELKRLQRPDGGWSQAADRASDAFATGQSLYALQLAGISAADATVRRGVEFLVRTQQPDGTWVITSRPDPESGKPADYLNPITYAAASWAVLGMAPFQTEERSGPPPLAARTVAQPDGPDRTQRAAECPIGECPGRPR